MSSTLRRLLSALAVALLLAGGVPAADKADDEKAAGDLFARFDKGDPGWQVRLTSLVELARLGPSAVPVLVEKLKSESPSVREFAAQATILFSEPGMKPALEKALDDSEASVRAYAIQALSMLGPLARTERHDKMLTDDPSTWGVRPMLAAAFERDDRPDPAAFRKQLANYDLRDMDRARLGEIAPDFTLTDYTGKAYRLSQFRGKQSVVLRFILHDY
jgi:HEAT repeat protein